MRVQAFLRATAAPGRDLLQLGPFTAYFHPTANMLKYLDDAIPADAAEPDGDDPGARASPERERLPAGGVDRGRAAPGVAAALERAGTAEELRRPLDGLSTPGS